MFSPRASISAANSCAPKGSAILRTWARKKHDPQTDWFFTRCILIFPLVVESTYSEKYAQVKLEQNFLKESGWKLKKYLSCHHPVICYHILFWFRVVGRFHLDSTQVCCNKSSRFLIRIWLFKRDDPKKAALLTIKNTRKCIVFRTSNNHNECIGDVLRSCFLSLRTSP